MKLKNVSNNDIRLIPKNSFIEKEISINAGETIELNNVVMTKINNNFILGVSDRDGIREYEFDCSLINPIYES